MRKLTVRVSTCISVVCLLTASVLADWPEFRGPTGQGLAEAGGLPVSWSESENIAWKVPVEGLGWSSPVIVDDRIYLTTAVPGSSDEQSLRVLCLDAGTGDVIWDREVFRQTGPVEIHKNNSHASPTPIVEDDRLYVHFGPHGTACLDLDGGIIWKTNELRYRPQHGNGGSPAVAGDLLIICCDGTDLQYVVGLEKATGEIRWKTDRDTDPSRGFSFSTPLLIEAGGRVQAVCPGSNAVFSYDPASGEEIWRVRYGDGYSVVPRPVFAHGLVYVCTGYNRPLLMAIDPTGRGDVTDSHVVWQTTSAAPHNPSPLVVGENLYFVSDRGVATCLDARTGEEHWQQRIEGEYWASPLFADNKIYFQDKFGTGVVIAAGPEYRELGRNMLGENDRTFASYAVWDGALFIRTETHLYRVENGS
jgi:outer membrane protein assembly factor BamB